MPHIAVTMLPGRDRETKQKLAENLCNTLIETLGVDAKFVSVSVEDVEMNMKKLLLIPLLLLTVLSMAACGGGDDEPFRPGQPETPEQPGEKEDGEPETPDVSSLNVNITVGDRTVTATMEDNAAARDFLSRLPLEITLNDITIYAPWGNVAIFCKSWSHSNALIKIGRIDGNGIEVLSIAGDIPVKIERR